MVNIPKYEFLVEGYVKAGMRVRRNPRFYAKLGSVLGFHYPFPEVSENLGRVTEILNVTYPLVSEFFLGCYSEFQL